MKKFLVLLGALLIVQTLFLIAGEEDIVWMKKTHSIYHLEFMYNSNLFLTRGSHGSRDGVIIFNTEGDTVKVIYNCEGLNLEDLDGIYDAHFSQDGQYLALMWEYGSMPYHRMELYSTATWERIKVIDMPVVSTTFYSTRVLISPDNRIIVGINSAGLYFFDAQNGELIKHLIDYGQDKSKDIRIYQTFYSPDGQYIYFIATDNKLRYLNTQTYQIDYTIENQKAYNYGIALSKNGNMIANMSGENELHIINTITKETIFTIPVHTNEIRSLAFSNDNKFLGVSFQNSMIINIYNIQTKEIANGFKNTTFESISFSNDDKFIITNAGQYLILLSNNITSVNDDKDNTEFNVLYPNPTTNTVNVKFKLNLPAFTKIIVYDNTGREVKSVFQGHLDYGEQNIKADIWDLRAGNYFLRVNLIGTDITFKLIINR